MTKLYNLFKAGSLCLVVTLLFSDCADDQHLLTTTTSTDAPLNVSVTGASLDCSACTYVVPSNTTIVDGLKLGIQPGNVLCLSAANQYTGMIFRNIVGAPGNPVIIRNCGGVARIDGTGKGYTLRTERSQHIRITGGSEKPYGIQVFGGRMGVMLETLTTEVEVDRIEVFNTGFAGIMAKTEPTCNDETIRGNFIMRNVSLHHNYVHDTGGEGFYIGHSFYTKGITLSCGVRLPHEIHGVKIYNNIVVNSGWEAIQVGSAPKGAMVFNNRVENYGMANVTYQNNGVQFGEGAPGTFFSNYINGGKGVGLVVVGNGDNFIHDNVFVNTGTMGIFVDEREDRGAGFRIINNTIINPGTDGIRLYSEYVPNVVMNNLVVNPGYFSYYVYPRSSADSYLYLLNKQVPVTKANNIFTNDLSSLRFVSAAGNNYRLSTGSVAIDAGADISMYKITTDYAKQPRVKGLGVDVGALEFQY